MKRYSILLIIILCSLFCFSQVKQQYNQYGGLWKRLSLRWDGGFQLPRSPVSTADLYSSVIDSGQVYYDPSDSSVRYYTGFQWLTIGTGGSSRFGVSGEDESASQNRYFNFHDSYTFTIDSMNSGYLSFNAANGFGIADLAGNYYLRLNNTNGSQLFAPDFSNNVQVNDGNITLSVGAGDYISSTVLPYNSGTAVVPMVQDTVTGKWYRQTITGSSTPTLQQVFDTETGEAALDKNDTINNGVYNYHIRSTTATTNGFHVLQNDGGTKYGTLDIKPNSVVLDAEDNEIAQMVMAGGDAASISLHTQDNDGRTKSLDLHLSPDSLYIYPNTTDVFNFIAKGLPNKSSLDGTDSVMVHDLNGKIWVVPPTVFGGSPGGSNKQFQYNNSSAFGGTTGVEYGNSNELVKITEQNTADTILKIVGKASQTGDFSSIMNADGEKIGGISSGGYNYASNRFEPWYTIIDECGGTVTYEMFNKQVSGTGSALSHNGSTNVPINWMQMTKYSVGTSSSGSGSWSLNAGGANTNIYLDGNMRFNFGTKILLDTLSDGTNTYYVCTGIGDNQIPSTMTRGIYFRYTNADSSGAWIIGCRVSGTTEKQTSVTVAANTSYELEFTTIGSTAWFYINDVLVGSISTNVPNNSSALVIGGNITKTAGSITRALYQDWISVGFRHK